MKRVQKPPKSILHDYMRDAYEEFAELLWREIQKDNPKSKATEMIKKAMKKVMKDHFGEDPQCGIDFD
jgi:hypothetical protein